MKIALYYFTGSGNSKIVAAHYKKEIENLGFSADLYPIESFLDQTSVDVSSYDRFGIFCPVHGFSAPRIVRRFAKKLKADRKIPYFLAMISGEPINLNHNSADAIKRKLKKKFLFESEFHYVLGYNMIFRHTEERAYKMYEAMEKIIPLDLREYLLEGKRFKLKRPFLGSLFAFIVTIQFIYYPVNGKMFRINKKKCIQCMKCVNSCPVHNIEYKDGKFKFHSHCMMCTRCSFNCPTDAFNIAGLNAWRVNKPYLYKADFAPEVDKHSNYCKKAYKRYFDAIEARLKEKGE